MELIEGPPLDQYWVDSLWPDSNGLARLIQLFAKIADAVEQAHRLGIIHRDLKPSNIRIDRWGEPHVLDFGLARLLEPGRNGRASPITVSGQVLGSLPWASPEHVSAGDDRVIATSDVYSLGVMLYQALTGRFPYSTNGPITEVMREILKSNPAPPSRVSSVWPKRLDSTIDAIVLNALNKSAAARYQSATEFGADLRAYALGSRRLPKPRHRIERLFLLVLLAATFMAMGFRLTALQYIPTAIVAQMAPGDLPWLINSIGMRMVKIPPGQFTMGSSSHELGHRPDEVLRAVQINKAFFIGVTLVTRTEYAAVMGGSGHLANNGSDGNLPMDGVSWNDANEFCRRLSVMERRQYRLPAEAEWEYACRAGSTATFGQKRPLDEVGWYAANSGRRLHPVGCKIPNAWGLYDMLGNVAEWCSGGVPGAIPGQNDGLGASQTFHVARGGSAFDGPLLCRAASRREVAQPNENWHGIGLRVVMDVASARK